MLLLWVAAIGASQNHGCSHAYPLAPSWGILLDTPCRLAPGASITLATLFTFHWSLWVHCFIFPASSLFSSPSSLADCSLWSPKHLGTRWLQGLPQAQFCSDFLQRLRTESCCFQRCGWQKFRRKPCCCGMHLPQEIRLAPYLIAFLRQPKWFYSGRFAKQSYVCLLRSYPYCVEWDSLPGKHAEDCRLAVTKNPEVLKQKKVFPFFGGGGRIQEN